MGRESSFAAETWALDLGAADADWRTIPTSFRRRALAVAALDGALLAVGGMGEDGKTCRETFVLDPLSGTWSDGPQLPEHGFGVAAIGSGGRAWASGGEGTLYSWAPGESSWRPEGRQHFGRLFGQLVARTEGEILCVGGICDGAQVRAIERLAVRAEPPAEAVAVEASLAHGAPATSHLRIASPSRARNRQAAELVGDRLLLFGGNSSLEQHDFAPENFLDEGWALDLRSLEWQPLRDLPVQRQSLRTVALDEGAILAMGGFGHDGEGTRSFSDVFRYSSKADVWGQLSGLPANRTQFAAVRDGDDLWLLGGLDYQQGRQSGSDFVHATEVWRATLAGDGEPSFEPTGIQLPVGRRAFGCAILGRSVYIVGGMTDGFERLEECLELDLDTHELREFPAPRAQRISPDLVALDGRLYMIGGASARGGDGSGSDTSIEVYDPQTRTWSVWTEDFGIEPAHVSAFAHRGRILLISTQTPDPAAIDLVWLDPGAESRP
jgi:N-acetylneuraminic acid mutarotase